MTSEFKTIVEVYNKNGRLIDLKQFRTRDEARHWVHTRLSAEAGGVSVRETRRKHKGITTDVLDDCLQRELHRRTD